MRVISPIMESFIPDPHFLEDETVQKEIRMAPYRIQIARFCGVIGIILFVPALIVFLVLSIPRPNATIPTPDSETVTEQIVDLGEQQKTKSGNIIAGVITITGLFLIAEAANEWLTYEQWQFILTNKRIILVTPDPDRKGFADAIYLKRGKIQVLDTNFSRNPMWGFVQILSGSRDVMLSMGGYEFLEQGAKVKGGLRFPDVSPEDINELEILIFGG